jgi:MFS family permease
MGTGDPIIEPEMESAPSDHSHENGHHHLGFASDTTDTKVFDTEEKRHMAVKDPSLFPDGGLRAWSVVGAAFLLVFCTFGIPRRWPRLMQGIANGFGIFQTYLITHQLSNYSQADVAWIGSVQIFLSFFGGLFSGRYTPQPSTINLDRACDTYGPRWLLLTGSIFFLLSLFMTGLCSQYWQFFLAQALLTGLGCGFTQGPNNS